MSESDASTVAVENFVLCEWASWDEFQRPTIHGLLQKIEVPRLPDVRDVIGVIFDVWAPPSTTVALRVLVEGPPGCKPFSEPREFLLPIPADGIRGVGATLEHLELTAEGVYSVSIVHEGRAIARRRFRVLVVQKPGFGTTTTATLQ